MTKPIRIAVLISILLYILLFTTEALPSQAKCNDISIIQHKLLTNGYAYVGTGIDPRGFAFQLYINNKTNSLVVVGITEELKACYLILGVEWQAVITHKI